ncbi:MAG: biopolymer transporter ExbD [Xanthomonadaceae bacterium]|nr:biopolymer transporter ExbD [Xanthomonadaceae bacterium]
MAGSQYTNDDEPISTINITPFVDVVLVLLVIFMVTAPALMKETLGIQLPKSTSSDSKSVPTSVQVAILKNGQVRINAKSFANDAEIEKELKTLAAQNPEIQAVISADTDSKHGDVVKVMDQVKSAKITHIGIQVQKR